MCVKIQTANADFFFIFIYLSICSACWQQWSAFTSVKKNACIPRDTAFLGSNVQVWMPDLILWTQHFLLQMQLECKQSRLKRNLLHSNTYALAQVLKWHWCIWALKKIKGNFWNWITMLNVYKTLMIWFRSTLTESVRYACMQCFFAGFIVCYNRAHYSNFCPLFC